MSLNIDFLDKFPKTVFQFKTDEVTGRYGILHENFYPYLKSYRTLNV